MKNRLYFLLTLFLMVPASYAAEGGGLKLLSFTTLIGEMITLAIFVWVIMKYVWPPLMKAIEDRQKEISDGLSAAEKGRRELAEADVQKASILKDARHQSGEIISDGEQRKATIIEAAKQEAEIEKARIIEQGKRELETERVALRREMEQKLGDLVLAGASQILQREVNANSHNDIIDSLKKGF